jgi:hypothetical protein
MSVPLLRRRVADLHRVSAELRPDPHYLDRACAGRSLMRSQREAVVNFNTEVRCALHH